MQNNHVVNTSNKSFQASLSNQTITESNGDFITNYSALGIAMPDCPHACSSPRQRARSPSSRLLSEPVSQTVNQPASYLFIYSATMLLRSITVVGLSLWNRLPSNLWFNLLGLSLLFSTSASNPYCSMSFCVVRSEGPRCDYRYKIINCCSFNSSQEIYSFSHS